MVRETVNRKKEKTFTTKKNDDNIKIQGVNTCMVYSLFFSYRYLFFFYFAMLWWC